MIDISWWYCSNKSAHGFFFKKKIIASHGLFSTHIINIIKWYWKILKCQISDL